VAPEPGDFSAYTPVIGPGRHPVERMGRAGEEARIDDLDPVAQIAPPYSPIAAIAHALREGGAVRYRRHDPHLAETAQSARQPLDPQPNERQHVIRVIPRQDEDS